MIIREATHDDNDALCALERRTPLNIDETAFYIDHTNFFEMHDLQERTVVMLAEEEGEVIGVCAGALHQAPLAGRERLLLYIHHERIAPERQRQGIGGALTRAISEYWKERESAHIDSSYWYIAAGNRQSRNFAERGGNRPWPVCAYWYHLGAEGMPSLRGPRRIGAGPIYDIVRLINTTHEGEDLFRPYEQVEFGQRLSRSTDYGWGDVYGAFEGSQLVAVAGLFRGSRGMIVDYGYERGAEREMAALIQSLNGEAMQASGEPVNIFVSPQSALFGELERLPHTLYEILFYAPRIDPPALPRPLHVDPVYF